MSRLEVRYICQACGYVAPRWMGKCPDCGQWNSLVEEERVKEGKIIAFPTGEASKPQPLNQLQYSAEHIYPTNIAELDRVLGGGVVAGSAVLVGGDPGIGKSTLMLQAANALSKNEKITLYVTGEESAKQVRLRAERLGTLSPGLHVLPETNLFVIENRLKEVTPQFLIIDSIQTIYREDLPSAPGSVSQVRECAAYLVRLAKNSGIPFFIIGHVTKEGAIAGPRVLEHMVDTVLYFEGERHRQYRILRATKNRFGPINEVGIFEMEENGLVGVANPSEIFLSERPKAVSGSVVTATVEGTRPLLVELQALVSGASTAIPRRTVTGLDYNRALIIAAVLEKRLGLRLSAQDIYLNVAGGVRAAEPAIDLGLAVAIVSCFKGKPVDPQVILVGEVGLAGEVRAVNQIDVRLNEAAKMGFRKAIIPQGNLKAVKKIKGLEVVGVGTVKQAVEEVLQ